VSPGPAEKLDLAPALHLVGDRCSRRSRSRKELERRLRERLDALGPAPCAELLHVLTLSDFERAGSENEVAPGARAARRAGGLALWDDVRMNEFVLPVLVIAVVVVVLILILRRRR
jgi:hypothetical protein